MREWACSLGEKTFQVQGMAPFNVPFTEEVVLDELMTLWEAKQMAKKLDKQAKTKLLVRTKDQGEFEYSLFKPGSLDPADPATLEICKTKVKWWPDVKEVWVIGKGWQPIG